MSEELGGSLYLIMDVVLVLVLAGALIYGIMRWRTRSRNPAVEAVRDEATRDAFDESNNEPTSRRAG